MNEPKALLITAVILAVFAVIPGFPTIVFAVLSAACAGGGYLTMRNRKNTQSTQRNRRCRLSRRDEPERPGPLVPGRRRDLEPVEAVTFALTVPLIVDIALIGAQFDPSGEARPRSGARAARALFRSRRSFPGVHLRLNDNLSEGEYRIMVNEIPVASGAARPATSSWRDRSQPEDVRHPVRTR